jgi:type III pantothenate kinase
MARTKATDLDALLAPLGGAGQPPLNPRDVAAVSLGSVAPRVTATVRGWLKDRGFPVPVEAGVDHLVPIPNRTLRPEEVGVDRLLNAYEIKHRFGGPAVVIDAGSAITLDVVDRDGAYLGGAIAPGIRMCFSALHEHTALIPLLAPMSGDPPLIGRSSEEALSAGILRGVAGMVAHLLVQYREALGKGTMGILTGGDADQIAPLLPDVVQPLRSLPSITLDALARFARAVGAA